MTLFQRDDWTLFRNLNTLGQSAGVPKERLAALVIKELADNALDAGAEASVERIAPGTYRVLDNGPGIEGDDAHIAMLFSVRRPLTSSKLYRLPLRGALGNGLRVVVGAVLSTGGIIQVETKGRALNLVPQDDGTTSVERMRNSTLLTGTSITIRFGPALAEQDAVWMANIALKLRGESFYTGKTSPYWYDSDSFYETLQAAGEAPIESVLSHFGAGKKKVVDKVERAANDLTREEADNLLAVLRGLASPDDKGGPHPNKLGKVGERAFPFTHGYARKTGEMDLAPARGRFHARIPYVVEVWASRLDKGERPKASIYINRTPIGAEVNAGMGKDGNKKASTWITGCGLNHYTVTGKHPMHIRICVTSPYMPITNNGKEPNLLPILHTVTEAANSAARKAKVTAPKGVSKTDSVKQAIPRAVRAASGEGAHRFSLRQLFYAVRPILQDSGIDELDYGYFATIITEYEADRGEIKGMYRDARGTLYHPHTGEQIALGTLSVEKYKTPKYAFNKVLYIEKGGFFPLLIDEGWPERHDCALLTSQGMASRAARDMIDLMGDSGETLQFFCIHDADGPGTIIYEKLVEATRARAARRVKVINLGLEPWEAKRMGLLSERVQRAKGRVPVAEYVKYQPWDDEVDRGHEDWEEWLQTGRYELNAMDSGQFLAWLDKKMEPYKGKVVPPQTVLQTHYEEETARQIRARLLDQLAADAGLDQQVSAMMEHVKSATADRDLRINVQHSLDETPASLWSTPIVELARETARSMVAPPGWVAPDDAGDRE